MLATLVAHAMPQLLNSLQQCDMSGIMNLRNEYKEAFEKKHGVRLGFMSAFIKVTLCIARYL